MENWIESYRGVVSAWECDIVEHFTIAYYFEKFADATRNFIELIDMKDELAAVVGTGGSRIHATFQHELRAGSAFHMLSAVVASGPQQLQLGHQLIDTASGKTATWVAETLNLPRPLDAETCGRLAAMAIEWPGPDVPPLAPPPAHRGALTGRDRVKTWELDETGSLSLSDHVHRFSSAGMHFLTSIGMTGAYMSEQRRGFSTFMLDVVLTDAAQLADRVDTHTAVARLGNTSLQYVHTMWSPDGRALASMVQAGVHLDLDARRPTPIPADIRANVETRLAAEG